MSVSDNYSPDISVGDGSTLVFSGNWKVFNEDFFVLQLQDVTTGILTDQILGVDYALTFDDTGYVATMVVAPTSSNNVVRSRNITINQTVPFKTSKGFEGGVTENAFDKITAIAQDQQDQIDRSPKSPVGSSGLVLPIYSAGLIPVWSSSDADVQVNSTKSITDVEGAVDAVAALTAQSGVVVSSGDTSVGFLDDKLLVAGSMSKTINNAGSSETLTLGISFANQSQAEAGVNNSNSMTSLRTKQAIDFQVPAFVTAAISALSIPTSRSVLPNQTITSGGALTLQHGLSSTPRPSDVKLELECTTAEHGYSIGDIIPLGVVDSSGAASGQGVSITTDATNVNVRYGNATAVFIGINNSTGAVVSLTNASWEAIFIADA